MNQSLLTKRYVVSYFLMAAVGLSVIYASTEAESSKSAPVEVLQRMVRADEDRVDREAYEKRNAEIVPCLGEATVPQQGNAALLYYQAFLRRPEPNETVDYKMHTLSYGTKPDRQIRTYLGQCMPVIEIVEMASRMPGCVWDVWPEQQQSWISLRRETIYLSEIVLGDSVTLASDEKYLVALERCLTVRRLARHLTGVSESYPAIPLSTICDERALCTIQYVLGVMPPNADTLTWFRGQLAVAEGAPPDFPNRLQAYVKAYLNDIQTNSVRRAKQKNLLVEEVKGEQAKESVKNLTDEQYLSRVGEVLQRLIDRIFQTVDSEMTYDEKHAQIHKIVNEPKDADSTDPVDRAILNLIGLPLVDVDGLADEWYAYQVRHQAHINGVKAAVEVYLIAAKTGELPGKLPDYLPKDPFTGRNFIYEKTDEGFALRCQGEEFLSGKNRWLEFKVSK